MEHRELVCSLIFTLLWARVSQTMHFLYRAVMREMMKNLGQKFGGVSHQEHSSVTCKGAALFYHSNKDTCRKGLPEHLRDHTSGSQGCRRGAA